MTTITISSSDSAFGFNSGTLNGVISDLASGNVSVTSISHTSLTVQVGSAPNESLAISGVGFDGTSLDNVEVSGFSLTIPSLTVAVSFAPLSYSSAIDFLKNHFEDGPDLMNGSAGPDQLFLYAGADTAFGGAGNDVLDGGDGQDFLRGDDGDDSINGGADFDDINGNKGNDTAHGGEGNDWVVGGQDQDILYGDNGNDIVYGNLGNDTVSGGNGDDWVRGGQGDDSVDGGAGNDLIWGDRGNDTLTGGAGADMFHTFAGAGVDTVTDFKGAEGDRVVIDDHVAYTIKASASGLDTIITLTDTGDTVVLQGVARADFHDDWVSIAA